MKKPISFVLIIAMLVSLCSGMSFVAFADGAEITAEVQGNYTPSETAQDITIRLNISGVSATYCGFSIESLNVPDDFIIKSYSTSNTAQAITGGDYNTGNGCLTYMTSDMDDTIPADTYYEVIITAPANASGNFTVTFNNVIVSAGYGATNLATAESLSVDIAIASAGYTAALSTTSDNNEVVSGGEIPVNVAVSHSSDTVFNAGEFKLSYDGTKLTPNTDNLGLSYKIEGEGTANAVLIVEDYGVDKLLNYEYVIWFTAASVNAETTVDVALISAKFVNKDMAASSDLIDATFSSEPVTITIKVNMVNVTLPDGTTATTQKGQDYTFDPDDTANYDYTDVTATVGGENVTIKDNGDGTWTIPGQFVTDDIEINYTKTAKSYDVEWTGAGAKDVTDKPADPLTATYGVAFEFTVPNKIDASAQEAGKIYSATVSIAGSSYSASASAGEKVTIPGNEIVGKITITIDVEDIPANGVAVQISGENVKFEDGTTSKVVTPGTELNLVLTPETGYIYSVKIGETEIMNNQTTTYKLNVSGATTITVTKTLDVSSVEVYEYAEANNGSKIWLVIYDGTLEPGKVPTYEDKIMFWSEKYDAYCYLVIAATLDVDTAKTNVGAKTDTAIEVDYGMDINGTGVTDAADAQFVWNMYNAQYGEFNSTVTMAQFLAADQNAISDKPSNWKLSVEDVQVIIAAILAGNATV